MVEQHLIRVLRQDNPWLDGAAVAPWIARHLPARYIERRVSVPVDRDRAVLVVGPRQSGKSTLLWHSVQAQAEPVLALNCEEPSIREWLRSPALFLSDLAELGVQPPVLLLDEVQHLDDAGLFIKGLVDRRTGIRVLATGSSAFDLDARTRESLAGRARRIRLLPLSVHEVLATVEGPRLTAAERSQALIDRMLVLGGYPAVVSADEPDVAIADLVEAFVVRDASDRFRIRNVAAFRKLLGLMASQVGNLCNYSEWAALTGVSNDTVAEHARLLEEAHVVRLLRPFIGGKRAELTRAPKVYLLDNGVRNQLFGGFAPIGQRADRGPLLESLVLAEIEKLVDPLLDTVRYWRTKGGAEVDFVVERRGRRFGVEVKYRVARPSLPRAARSFVDAYQPDAFLVVARHLDVDVESSEGVRFVDVAGLAPALDELLSAC